MANNILITRHDKIGDFVVSLPMFKVLKTQRPELTLYALVAKINADLARSIDFIDHVIVYDKNNLDRTLEEIKAADIDTSISAFINSSLAWLLFRAGINTRIAPATKLAQLLFNRRVTQRRSRVEKTEFAYNLDLLKAFDDTLTLDYAQPVLRFDSVTDNEVFQHFKTQHNITDTQKIIAFHPGSGGSSEGNLTIEDYLRLAQKAEDHGYTVVFTFGPDDQRLKQAVEKRQNVNAILFDSSGSLTDFCRLIQHFSLFVSTSTGPMHLAAATNTKTLSFFGQNLVSTPARWASISAAEQQHNIIVPESYGEECFLQVQQTFEQIVK